MRHPDSSGFPLVATTALLAAASFARAQSIQSIDPPPGWTGTATNTVSADGNVAGGSVTGPTNPPPSPSNAAIRWTASGGTQLLALPSFTNATSVLDASDDGLALIGTGEYQAGPGPFDRTGAGFRWTESDVQPVSDFPTFTTVTAANGDASIMCGHRGMSLATPFRWTAVGGFVDYGHLAGAGSGEAHDLDADGDVMVGFCFFFSNSHEEACCWTSAPAPVRLNALGLFSWRATSVSNNGAAVVGYGRNGVNATVPLLWRNLALAATPLSPAAGFTNADAQAISGNGAAIGGSSWTTASQRRATMWINDAPLDLNTYLPTLGISLAGWVLEEVTALSADGNVIVGNGKLSGESRGFVVTLSSGDPCTADFNDSGAVDATDIFVFLDAWFGQNGQSGPDLSADFDGSGAVDATDIFVFLDAWFDQNGTCD